MSRGQEMLVGRAAADATGVSSRRRAAPFRRDIKRRLVGALVVGGLGGALLAGPAAAQRAPAQQAMVENVAAPAEPAAIPLYGDKVGSAKDEVWTRLGPMNVVRNVTRPTLTPILPPPGKATGAAVILAPGGGMIFLAMPSAEIARNLTDKGIAVFVLKYRVEPTPREVPELMRSL